MRFIPTRVHGMMDYLMGLLLIVSPWVFNFDDVYSRAAVYVPVILGVGALLYSLLTRYEMGLTPAISMRGHLMMDLGAGLLLAASPWLFGFSNQVWVPHVVLGLLEVGAALMTRTLPTADSIHDYMGHHHRGVHAMR